MNDIVYDVALSYDESITSIEKNLLLEKYGSSKDVLSINKSTLRNILGRRWTGNRFEPDDLINKSKKVMPFLERAGINIVRFDSNNYPGLLSEIPDKPFLLYYRGSVNYDSERSIAIVGTRKADGVGLERTKIFSSQLTKNGFTIISGLAHGVDSAAHYHCVENKGKTIAVMGCGIDKIYPHANKLLGRRIIENGGCIISEYPPEVRPNRWNFPKRNRIIVGLSRSVFIVQSPSRSGSMISACLAADYNRDLFVASPDKRCGELDRGNSELILMGGKEVHNPREILKDCNLPIA